MEMKSFTRSLVLSRLSFGWSSFFPTSNATALAERLCTRLDFLVVLSFFISIFQFAWVTERMFSMKLFLQFHNK